MVLILEFELEVEVVEELIFINLLVCDVNEFEKEILFLSFYKESMIDLNLDILIEEDNGGLKKGEEDLLLVFYNYNWIGMLEVVNSKFDWMKVDQVFVKIELSLGCMKLGLKLDYLKFEDLNVMNFELNLEMGRIEGLNVLKFELDLELGMVKLELFLSVVKFELDFNMEVELDFNMEMKEELLIVKDELLIVKEELLIVKENLVNVKVEINLESDLQLNLFWYVFVFVSVMKENNDLKVVRVVKKVLVVNIGFL